MRVNSIFDVNVLVICNILVFDSNLFHLSMSLQSGRRGDCHQARKALGVSTFCTFVSHYCF